MKGRTVQRISHVVGFDDCPFDRTHKGNIPVIGAVFARERLEGVLSTSVRRDGANATDRLAAVVEGSRFFGHLQCVMLQGIALGGFNVVDIVALADRLGMPVLVVMRRRPDMGAVRDALLSRVPGGAKKWGLIERAGPPEKLGRVYVQRADISRAQAEDLVVRTTRHGDIPEPVRTAHLIAGGITTGESRGRA